MKANAKKILTAVLLAVFLFSTARVLTQWLDQSEGDDAYRNAAELAQSSQNSTLPITATTEAVDATEPPVTEAPTAPPEPEWIPAPVEDEDPHLETLASTDLDTLRQVNEDVLGWIFIPDTWINYPLLQGEDNTFYLEHTWEKNPNPYGSIFLECQNSPDMTDFNTIIYGHNMLNGSMFGGLSSFAYQWYWEWNRYVYLVTDEGVFRYEIFSSYQADVDSATYGLSYNQLKTREDFISMALENSQIDTGIIPAPTDRIITLSTCTGLGYESRRVVHAYLKMIQPDTP